MSTPLTPAEAAANVRQCFATTVALITSHNTEYGSNVMACEWTMNISWQPLRIMAVINHQEFTHGLITSNQEFGVNLCSDQQALLAHFAGTISGRDQKKLEAPIFTNLLYPGTRIKAPMIRGCLLNAECTVEQTVELGSHTAFIGRVVAVRIHPKAHPLFYHQGMFFSLGNHIPKSDELLDGRLAE